MKKFFLCSATALKSFKRKGQSEGRSNYLLKPENHFPENFTTFSCKLLF